MKSTLRGNILPFQLDKQWNGGVKKAAALVISRYWKTESH